MPQFSEALENVGRMCRAGGDRDARGHLLVPLEVEVRERNRRRGEIGAANAVASAAERHRIGRQRRGCRRLTFAGHGRETALRRLVDSRDPRRHSFVGHQLAETRHRGGPAAASSRAELPSGGTPPRRPGGERARGRCRCQLRCERPEPPQLTGHVGAGDKRPGGRLGWAGDERERPVIAPFEHHDAAGSSERGPRRSAASRDGRAASGGRLGRHPHGSARPGPTPFRRR